MQPSGTTELNLMNESSPRICHALRGANFEKIEDFSLPFFLFIKRYLRSNVKCRNKGRI